VTVDPLTVKEVAAMLRISRRALYDLIEFRAIPSYTIGKRRFFSRAAVEAFVRQRMAAPELRVKRRDQ